MTSRAKAFDGTAYRTAGPETVKARNPATGVYVPAGHMLKARNPLTGLYEQVAVDPGVPNPAGLAAKAAVTVAADGQAVYGILPDTYHDAASMVKLMTVYTARQILGSDLTSTVTIVAADIITSTTIDDTIDVDDVVQVGELIYAALMESSNNCAEALARYCGSLLPGGDPGRTKFIAEMNARGVSDFGWAGAQFVNPFSVAYVTPRQLAELLWWVNDNDPWMLAAAGTLSRDFVVSGGPDPRTVPLTHTINPANVPGFVAGKTGTSGLAGIAVLFDKGGDRFASVVMQTPVAERYPDLNRMIDVA